MSQNITCVYICVHIYDISQHNLARCKWPRLVSTRSLAKGELAVQELKAVVGVFSLRLSRAREREANEILL